MPRSCARFAQSMASRPVGGAAAVGDDFPLMVGDPSRVNRQHYALRAEMAGAFGEQWRTVDGGGVEADFVGAGAEQEVHFRDALDAAADGQGDAYFLGDRLHGGEQCPPILDAGGDVEKDQLVGAFGIVAGGDRRRVAGVAEVDEVDSFDYPAVADVQAGYDAFGQHSGRLSRGRAGRSPALLGRRLVFSFCRARRRRMYRRGGRRCRRRRHIAIGRPATGGIRIWSC